MPSERIYVDERLSSGSGVILTQIAVAGDGGADPGQRGGNGRGGEVGEEDGPMIGYLRESGG